MKGDFIIACYKTKLDTTKENIKSPAKINTDIKVEKIHYKEEEKRKYYCSCCGKPFTSQKGNFSISYSPIYAGNNGYVTMCNSCRDKYFTTVTDFFSGNEEKAIDRISGIFDWYYEDSAVSATRKISADRSRIGAYPSKMCLNQTKNKGTTYLDTIRDRASNNIRSLEHLEELKNEGKTNLSQAVIERWGVDIFDECDYKILDDHYKMLKKANPNCDSNQEIFIKSLCHLNLLQIKALKANDTKGYIDANSEYAKTFKQAGLKTIQDSDKNSDDCWGVFMEQISQYTPEEYYKDKKLYKDYDDIGSLFTRFVLRPLKNLLLKTNERDIEYNVEDNYDE